MLARKGFLEVDGELQPAPAPRFSRSEVGVTRGAHEDCAHTTEVLSQAGFSPAELAGLRADNVIA